MNSIIVGVLSIICMLGGVNFTFGSCSVGSDHWITINADIPAPAPADGVGSNIIDGDFVQAGIRADSDSPTGYYYASIFLPDGSKGFIPAFIDIIMDNPLIEIVTLMLLSGCAIGFLKRVIRT